MITELACLFPDGTVKKCMRMDVAGSSDSMLVVHISQSQDDKAGKTRRRTIAHLVPVARHSGNQLDYCKLAAFEHTGSTNESQQNVFIKWSRPGDKQRAMALAREASFYTNELRALQGSIVPRFLGYYVSPASSNAENDSGSFAVSVFEDCYDRDVSLTGGNKDAGTLDFDEYRRQYMLAACALHRAGVEHGQLSLPQSISANGVSSDSDTSLISLYREFCAMLFSESCGADGHVLPIISGKACKGRAAKLQGVRIVDFTCAQRHNCRGAPLIVPGHSSRLGVEIISSCHEEVYCSELLRLETAVANVD